MFDSISLTGKVAIVTGAGGGIGSETARLFAQRGAHVILTDIDAAGSQKVATRIIDEGGWAQAHPLDLSDEQAIVALITTIMREHGRIDILHNNAADQSPAVAGRDGDVEHLPTDVWDRVFQVNLRGTMLMCRETLPHMVAAGRGSIINMASNLALQGSLVQAAYSAAKAGVIQLSRSIAASHGQRGIRCNSVSPGLTLTQGVRDHIPAPMIQIIEEETLAPTLGAPIDISEVVAFLASDAARNVNGQNWVADGGQSAHIAGLAAMRRFFSGEAGLRGPDPA